MIEQKKMEEFVTIDGKKVKLDDVVSKQIDNLSDEVKALFPTYVDRYTKIGLNTESISDEKIIEIATNLWTKVLKYPEGVKVVITDSPDKAWQAVQDLYEEKIAYVWPYIDGHWNASYFAYYDFIAENLFKVNDKDQPILDDNGNKIPLIYLSEEYFHYRNCLDIDVVYPVEDRNIIIVSRKPVVVALNENKLPHREDGPAIEYSDNWGVFCLNGVRMPGKYVMTPAAELDPKEVLAEENIEIRRELVRKIGVDRLLAGLDTTEIETTTVKIGEKDCNYTLYSINLGKEMENCKALKMEHASFPGTWLVEWVSEECETVKDAIFMRNSRKSLPEAIS